MPEEKPFPIEKWVDEITPKLLALNPSLLQRMLENIAFSSEKSAMLMLRVGTHAAEAHINQRKTEATRNRNAVTWALGANLKSKPGGKGDTRHAIRDLLGIKTMADLEGVAPIEKEYLGEGLPMREG